MALPLSRDYCYKDESEAREALEPLLSYLSSAEASRLPTILAVVFDVRQALLALPPDRRTGIWRDTVRHRGGLTDICITANESYLIPAFVSIGVECEVEVRLYSTYDIPKGLPLFHTYAVLRLGGSEFIVDVNADLYYAGDIGVIITPTRDGLYNRGTIIHTRRISKDDGVSCQFFTNAGCLYFQGENLRHVSIKNYFMDSDANHCPIVVTDTTTLYLSYSRYYRGNESHDSIEIVWVSGSRDTDILLWNVVFRSVAFMKVVCKPQATMYIEFLDNTSIEITLDEAGYPTEGDVIRYSRDSQANSGLKRYELRSAPRSEVYLPYPV